MSLLKIHRRKLSMEFFLLLLCVLSPLLPSVYGINTLSMFERPCFEAIYQFGDSIADTGNKIHETPSGAHYGCGRPPYGQTFFRHASGRCSDGRLIIDFLAQALKLPFIDAYRNKEGNFTHGVNFAVTGATALNVSTLAAKNITARVTKSSLLVQVNWFKSHLNTICTSPPDCKKKLENALFLMGEIGGNDYNFAAFEGKSMEELQNLVPDVVQTIVDVVKEVIDLGAKRIIVPGNFPVGCMTIYLATFKSNDSTMYDELNCLKSWNNFSTFHNDQLQIAIKDLQKENPDIAIVYADYFNAMTSILKDAPSQGFDKDVMLKACCGFGEGDYNFDNRRQCGSDGVVACPDPSKRVSWDGIHLTEHAYQLMADRLLNYILPTIAFI